MSKITFSRVLFLSLIFTVSGIGCTRSVNEPAKTVHRVAIAKIKGLDPVQSDDLYSIVESGMAYEGLLQYEQLKRPYQVTNNLAESLPNISADAKTYTFKLKKGVLFVDDASFKDTGGKGRELVADDVIYSYKRLADPALNSPGWWIFDGKIVGLNEWHDEMVKAGKTDYAKPVEGLKALDRYTIQILLKAPSYQFVYFLAMAFTGIVPREAVESYGVQFPNHAVGTGPYKLVEFNGNSRVIWDRNPTYRNELYPSEGEAGDKEKGLLADAGQPLPRNDRVVTTVMEEDQPRWLNFLAGKVDILQIPKDNFAQALVADKSLTPEMKAKGVQHDRFAELGIYHISFNMKDPLVGKNKLLRQALSLVMDSGPFIELFYGGNGIQAQGPIPPGLDGYDPAYKNPYRQTNVEKAKELLAKAGYPGGKGLPPLEYATRTDGTQRQMDEYFQKEFEKIGVQLKVDGYSWPEFQEAVKNGKGQIWYFAWGADYPDAENFLQLFYSKNVSPGPNDANYVNPAFDKLYEKALTLKPGPERTKVYQEMVAIVAEDCPWIWIFNRVDDYLATKWVKNFKYNDLSDNQAKYFGVDPGLKK